MAYKCGLKLWSINTDYYYEEAKKLYSEGIFDYIELYVVPNTLETLPKWKELNQASSPLVGEDRGEGFKKATHFYTVKSLDYSKELRKNQTEPEKILWHYLRNRQLNNMKFRRQEAIGDYIVDFVCYENKLIVELDGAGHLDIKQKNYDEKRDLYLKENGFTVLRIFNNNIYENIKGVLEFILKNTPHPTPLPQGASEQNNGIPFIIHAPHFAHGFNLAKKEKKESNLAIYREVKQFADELNAQYIIFHGGIDGDINETAHQLAGFNEPRALIENKPFVALPNKMGGEFCRGYNIDEIKLVKETAKSGFCLDFGHAICAANSFGVNVYEYCKDFLQFNPNMYHLTDLNDITLPYDSHLHLGMGELDFKQIFDMIPDKSYITFETIKNSKENLDDFAEDMEWLKSLK